MNGSWRTGRKGAAEGKQAAQESRKADEGWNGFD